MVAFRLWLHDDKPQDKQLGVSNPQYTYIGTYIYYIWPVVYVIVHYRGGSTVTHVIGSVGEGLHIHTHVHPYIVICYNVYFLFFSSKYGTQLDRSGSGPSHRATTATPMG